MVMERIVRTFTAGDYAVFAIMLVVSALIGIYFAIVDRKKNSTTEGYLMASRFVIIKVTIINLTRILNMLLYFNPHCNSKKVSECLNAVLHNMHLSAFLAY